MKALGSGSPIVVANQVGSTHRGEIGRAEFERGLGGPLNFSVPFDPKATRAMSVSGKALPAADATGKAAAELRRIAAQIAGREETPKPLWRRLLG